MDDITREFPADTTPTPSSGERGQASSGKGPEEVQRFERGEVAADLVVRDRLSASDPTMRPLDPEPVEPVAGMRDRSEGVDDVSADAAPAAAAIADPAAAVEPSVTPADDDSVAADAAARAVEDEASTLSVEDDLGDAEGLPPVPELADAAAVARMVFVLMLSSREGLSLLRLAQACNTTQKLVEEALVRLREQFQQAGLPVELARTGDTVKWMSGSETFPYLQRLRGVKKLERLSPAALETLAVIAYRQPVMRSEIEAIRGVKAGPMLRTLLHHKLVKVTGRADVPGRPLQYGTTPQFLERFGIASLQELPSIKEWKSLG
jgi:segregation and condensation protein B